MSNISHLTCEQGTRKQKLLIYMAGAALCLSAGTINGAASAFLIFERTVHMSGRVNDLMWKLIFDQSAGLLVACVLAGFFGGAYCAGKLIPYLKERTLLGVTLLLAIAAVVVLAGGTNADPDIFGLHRYFCAFLLAMAGGLQNGTTTQLVFGRTTHVTGDLTDMALAFSSGNRQRAIYLLIKITAFSAGGMTGFISIQHLSFSFVLLLCALGTVTGFYLLQLLTGQDRKNVPEQA